MDKVGELGVKDARTGVVWILRSGAKVEVLGVLGTDLVSEKPMPTLLLLSSVMLGDSSLISFMNGGLADLLRDPRIMGTAANEIRTQFCRRCPLRDPRALGLPFRAEGFPDDRGAGSH